MIGLLSPKGWACPNTKIFHDLNEKCQVLIQKDNIGENEWGINSGLHFTPLESPATCPVQRSASIGAYNGDEPCKPSGLLRDEGWVPLGANTGFQSTCELSFWKVEDLPTGFNGMRA